jgi:hypothetical protein
MAWMNDSSGIVGGSLFGFFAECYALANRSP